jgi:uncharacterized protein YggE
VDRRIGLTVAAFVAISAAFTLTRAGHASVPSPLEKQDLAENTISVSGSAQGSFDPDLATVTVGISKTGSTAKDAQDQVNTVADKVLNAVSGIVGDRKLVQTRSLNLSPNFSEAGNRIISFTASNRIEVRTMRIADVVKVVDAAIAAGATNLDGIEFGLRNPDLAEASLMQQAVANARKKADSIADGIGMRVVGVISVKEASQGQEIVMFKSSAVMDARTPIAPGQVSSEASVTVVFAFGS